MRKTIEIKLLRLVIWLLQSRNVARSSFMARAHNKALSGMAERIEHITNQYTNGNPIKP